MVMLMIHEPLSEKQGFEAVITVIGTFTPTAPACVQYLQHGSTSVMFVGWMDKWNSNNVTKINIFDSMNHIKYFILCVLIYSHNSHIG